MFSTQAYLTIPAIAWTQLTNNGDPNNPTFKALSPCYALWEDGDYHLADPSQLKITDFNSALLALQAASTRVGTFATLPPDSNPTPPLRLILLSQAKKDSLAGSLPFDQQAELAACFLSFTDSDGTLYYYQDPNLGITQVALILAAMKSCRRDVDIFPYYSYDSAENVWNVRPGADATAIKSVMDTCGIQTWTSLTRTITYSSTALLPVVTQESLPSGANLDQLAPPNYPVPHTGENVGVVMVPTIDRSSGHTVISAHYLQSFDSLADFSTQNLAIFPVDS